MTENYYKNVVLTDMENFWLENPPTEYPVRQYAAAKWFDQDLFAEFYHKVCNNEPLYTSEWLIAKWNNASTYFFLTEEEQEKFADFIAYYNTVSWWDFRAFSDDSSSAIRNSYTEIWRRWNTPRSVPEDQYWEMRTYTAPWLQDPHNPVDIPERYDPEWYRPEDPHDWKQWNLTPTAEETPREDHATWDYFQEQAQ